jgi:hypothetical protein
MKSITDMTPTELRIACAEKCGWEFQKCVDSNSEWIYDPEGRSINVCYDSLDDAKLGNYPDYEHDMNACMELMEKIWGKEPTAFISSNPFVKTGIYYVQCFSWRTEGDSVPLAIMRAFLNAVDEK